MAQKRRRGQRQRRTLSPRQQTVGLALLAVAVAAVAAYALKGTSPSAEAVAAPSAVPSAAPSGPSSLWFGDSIVEGCCRTSPTSQNMAQVASHAAGWAVPAVSGFGGTGYLTTATVNGVTRPTFPDNIGHFLSGGAYKIVVVAGGNNDGDISNRQGRFRLAVRSTFDQVKRALPHARLVVVGPYSPTGTGMADERRIEREEATRVGATFIDGIAEGWMVGHPELLYKDRFHPNDAGQVYLGQRLGADLKRLRIV